jgi:hypothetical protein
VLSPTLRQCLSVLLGRLVCGALCRPSLSLMHCGQMVVTTPRIPVDVKLKLLIAVTGEICHARNAA